jgi:hypothetical protein
MTKFADFQRVRIIAPEHQLRGKVGKVVRLRRADEGAWVRMDDDLPVELRRFSDDRKNDLLLFPEECEAAK